MRLGNNIHATDVKKIINKKIVHNFYLPRIVGWFTLNLSFFFEIFAT